MSLSLRTTITPSSWFAALPSRLWHAARDARQRMKRTAILQRELDRMDAHMLSDIGISRAQLRFELDRQR